MQATIAVAFDHDAFWCDQTVAIAARRAAPGQTAQVAFIQPLIQFLGQNPIKPRHPSGTIAGRVRPRAFKPGVVAAFLTTLTLGQCGFQFVAIKTVAAFLTLFAPLFDTFIASFFGPFFAALFNALFTALLGPLFLALFGAAFLGAFFTALFGALFLPPFGRAGLCLLGGAWQRVAFAGIVAKRAGAVTLCLGFGLFTFFAALFALFLTLLLLRLLPAFLPLLSAFFLTGFLPLFAPFLTLFSPLFLTLFAPLFLARLVGLSLAAGLLFLGLPGLCKMQGGLIRGARHLCGCEIGCKQGQAGGDGRCVVNELSHEGLLPPRSN